MPRSTPTLGVNSGVEHEPGVRGGAEAVLLGASILRILHLASCVLTPDCSERRAVILPHVLGFGSRLFVMLGCINLRAEIFASLCCESCRIG